MHYITCIVTRLTVVSLAYMTKNGGQVNMLVVNGSSQLLTTRHVVTILGISWGAFIISWITNAVYYKVSIKWTLYCVRYLFSVQIHPSKVEVSMIRSKLQLHVFGSTYSACGEHKCFNACQLPSFF